MGSGIRDKNSPQTTHFPAKAFRQIAPSQRILSKNNYIKMLHFEGARASKIELALAWELNIHIFVSFLLER